MNQFFFAVYPYLCLVIMVLGLLFRYLATPGEWNARSSNLFAQKSLATGSYLFHYAIILTFFGHVFGLLIPESVLSACGLSISAHTALANFCGRILAPCVFVGLAILLWRRLESANTRASTVPMDIVVILFIMWQSITGGWQDYASHFDVFSTIGPWIRSVLCCQPDPSLMAGAPWFLKAHVICGFAIFAMIPFSRLVHFFSLPLTWLARPNVMYRRRYENL